ncbi:hypothetical protein AVEN_220592-1 [Araneus ventricosus]|uniref:Uncharacterized protein n=1 Tax=Araneus ventricosus TaxID=182803 RepID=A0A4Y2U566_ARAVE|nr:hypothetical protein AVEN_220592-1 [Araneus ventricosus]
MGFVIFKPRSDDEDVVLYEGDQVSSGMPFDPLRMSELTVGPTQVGGRSTGSGLCRLALSLAGTLFRNDMAQTRYHVSPKSRWLSGSDPLQLATVSSYSNPKAAEALKPP